MQDQAAEREGHHDAGSAAEAASARASQLGTCWRSKQFAGCFGPEAVEEEVVETKNGGDHNVRHDGGIRRQFGIDTLLIVTAMYGVLFGGVRALGFSLSDFLIIVLFFTTVGIGQVFLFKGKHPLRASAVVGAILFPCTIGGLIYYQRLGGTPGSLRYPFFVTCLLLSIVGTTIGCVGGTVITGGFLLMDKARRWRTTQKARHHHEETDA